MKIKTALLKELKFLNDLYVTLHDYLFLTNVTNIFHYIPFAAFFYLVHSVATMVSIHNLMTIA